MEKAFVPRYEIAEQELPLMATGIYAAGGARGDARSVSGSWRTVGAGTGTSQGTETGADKLAPISA